MTDVQARAAALITVDWGTSACRAARIDRAGRVIDRLEGGAGILAVRDAAFEAALMAFLAPWLAQVPRPPVLMSGMIGSRQGWREAAYVRCPGGLHDVAHNLCWIDTQHLGRIAIVPGMDVVSATGVPDVMRGEETQIFGAFGNEQSGVCVLPGTHSKWAEIKNGRIVSFRSFMTGEVFAALKDHTILGRLLQPSAAFQSDAFLQGVKAGAAEGGPGALLHRVFAARTLGLFDKLPAAALSDYLSGLLIGAEIADAVGAAPRVTLLGSAVLTQRYRLAAEHLGLATASPSVDAAALGAARIAAAAGLVTFSA